MSSPTHKECRRGNGNQWKINQIAAKVVNWLMTYRPSIILLHIGTNDFVKNDDPTQAPAPLSHLLNLITTTLPGATVIVAQILPNDTGYAFMAKVWLHALLPLLRGSKLS